MFVLALAIAVAVTIGAVFVYRSTRPRQHPRFPARYIRPHENAEDVKRARA